MTKDINMKRLFLIIVAVAGFAISAEAQAYGNAGELYLLDETFYMDGIPLNDGDLRYILGEETFNNVYLPARKKLRGANTLAYIGGTFIGAGVGLAVGDLVSSAIYGYELTGKPFLIYGCVSLAGAIPAIIAWQMSKKGNAAYARIAETYNKETGKVMELTLGPAKSGFGIAFTF